MDVVGLHVEAGTIILLWRRHDAAGVGITITESIPESRRRDWLLHFKPNTQHLILVKFIDEPII